MVATWPLGHPITTSNTDRSHVLSDLIRKCLSVKLLTIRTSNQIDDKIRERIFAESPQKRGSRAPVISLR